MKIIRIKEVMELTGLARSTIYKFISNSQFPKSVALSDHCVGWVESEIQDWIIMKVNNRNIKG